MLYKLLYKFILVYCITTSLQAQLPDLYPEKKKTNQDTIKPTQKIANEKRFILGLNFSKMGLRPLVGGFTIDMETHKLFKKSWAYGAEFGYTEYYFRSRNFNVHNKGVYFKPMISYLLKISDDNTIMFSTAVPLGFFEESGRLFVGNYYYTFNPNEINFYRPNQFFYGLEFIATVKTKIASNLYVGFGGRYAPFIYSQNINDNFPMNTRYFTGSGYNLDYNDINQRQSNQHRAFALFGKIFLYF